VQAFRDILIRRHYTAILRASKGSDILAACGQLSGRAADEAGPPSYSSSM
jgi:23S rRNA (adenine2503-C2)-methyltransferase